MRTEKDPRNFQFGLMLFLVPAAVAAMLVPALLSPLSAQQVSAQTAASASPKDIADTWQGTLHTGRDLRTVVKVAKADSGGYTANFYSIDQGGQPLKVDLVTLDGSSVKMSLKMIGGSFEGKLSADGKTIDGNWSQGPNPMPLSLTRATPESEWTIPKPPPPMPPMAKDANPSFEVATVKPNDSGNGGRRINGNGRRFSTTNTSLADLIVVAYDVQKKQILNGPEWIDKDKFDVAGVPDAEGEPSNEQWKSMVQKLLAERFQLVFHHDTKEMPVYILSVAKGGPKNLSKSEATDDKFSVPIGMVPGGFNMPMRNVQMTDFTAFALQGAVLDRPVLDHTGIKGRYDFTLTWAPLGTEFEGRLQPPQATDNPPPGLFTAITEQLGMTLDATRAPADVIVIDHVEKPSPN